GRAARPRGRHDRSHRPPEDGAVHRGAAQDPLRQDHAPSAAQRRRGRAARRHDHARRPDGGRGHQGPVPLGPRWRRGGVTRSYPDPWTWREGPVPADAAAGIDLDGVLSDAASRQHYLEAPRRDWRAFFDACGDDPVIEEVKVLLDLLDVSLAIVLLTAR